MGAMCTATVRRCRGVPGGGCGARRGTYELCNTGRRRGSAAGGTGSRAASTGAGCRTRGRRRSCRSPCRRSRRSDGHCRTRPPWQPCSSAQHRHLHASLVSRLRPRLFQRLRQMSRHGMRAQLTVLGRKCVWTGLVLASLLPSPRNHMNAKCGKLTSCTYPAVSCPLCANTHGAAMEYAEERLSLQQCVTAVN